MGLVYVIDIATNIIKTIKRLKRLIDKRISNTNIDTSTFKGKYKIFEMKGGLSWCKTETKTKVKINKSKGKMDSCA